MVEFTSKYQLRPYQQKAVDAAVEFFKGKSKDNAIEVLPTGSGKSLIIANIALKLGKPVLIFQPSKEILEQNYKKIASYGFVQCAIYSASFNSKRVSTVTFCTIGSVVNHLQDLSGIKYCIIDECHLVNPSDGMYRKMIKTLGVKCVGLTATPYRLGQNSFGSILRFITRTVPRIFNRVIHVTQVRELLEQGFLAKLNYYQLQSKFDISRLQVNSTGQDYTDESLKREFERVDFPTYLESIVRRVLAKRQRVLVFTKLVEEAEMLAQKIKGAAVVSGTTPKTERERMLNDFKSGKIHCVCNVGVLTTGFDYPELDVVILARPTRSLSMYYQIVGRAIRPYPDKVGWIVDLCGTYDLFGKVENLEMRCTDGFKWAIWNTEKEQQLTNVYFGTGWQH